MKKRSAIALTLDRFFYPIAFTFVFGAMFAALFYSFWNSSVEHERFRVYREVELAGHEIESILSENERLFLLSAENDSDGWNSTSFVKNFLVKHPEVLAVKDGGITLSSQRDDNDSTKIRILLSSIAGDSAMASLGVLRTPRYSNAIKSGDVSYFGAFIPMHRTNLPHRPTVLLYSAINLLRETLRRHPIEGDEVSLFSSSGENMASTGFPNVGAFLRVQKEIPGYEGTLSVDFADPNYMFWNAGRIVMAIICTGLTLIIFVILREMRRDVKTLKNTASELRSSEERFRTIFEKSADALRIMDRHGRIVMVNSAYCDLVGTSYEELLHDFNAGDENLEVRYGGNAAFRAQFDAGTIKMPSSQVIKRSDGMEIPVEVSHSLFTIPKGGKLLLSTFHDVTERRRHELESHQIQKMDALGDFAIGIGNTLKNIAGIIMNSVEFLVKDGASGPMHGEYANIIFRESRRTAELADDLLVFARSKESDARPVHVAKLLHQVQKILESALTPGISLALSSQYDESVIRGDVHLLHQAIVNLALAAQSRMNGGGKIEINTSAVSLENVRRKFPTAGKSDYLLIAVSDNGTELDDYSARRIFEPFFNANNKDHHVGLRLSAAYSIVRSHKGFIDVEHGSGGGTTIAIYLPLEPSQPVEEKATPSNTPQTGSECVLIVDDEEAYRQIYQHGLSSLGYRVYTAENGDEAMAVYADHRGEIDLVVSDYFMPKMNGEELFHHLRVLDPAAKLILATGAIDLKEKSHLVNAGIEDVIEKPFQFDEMLTSVRKALDRT